MNQHIKEIVSVLKTFSIPFKILENDESLLFFNTIINEYARKEVYKYPLWENLSNWCGVDYRYSWEWFNQIIETNDLILFFEPEDDKNFILIDNAVDLIKLINNSYRFTFYISNIEAEFLYCYNDHDNLLASGKAIKWLSSYDFIIKNGITLFSNKS
ncbi:MAG: hypothetical protein IPP27_16585 [Bacteroidetes bacterium]|nr:hypothetical protein [Bacteroidota bacterium]MBL0033703.1 hypothetical protein [Bacteroidota bacterium]